MLNVCEQPWTLLITALVFIFVLALIHKEPHPWLLLSLILIVWALSFFVTETSWFSVVNKIHYILASALALLLIYLTVHGILLNKRYWWQWMIPLILATAAFSLDFYIETDREQINSLLEHGLRATEDSDIKVIKSILADDYSDSFHRTKDHFIRSCMSFLSRESVKKNYMTVLNSQIKESEANYTVIVRTIFTKDSFFARSYKNFVVTKTHIELIENHNRWQIKRIELLSIDHRSANWGIL